MIFEWLAHEHSRLRRAHELALIIIVIVYVFCSSRNIWLKLPDEPSPGMKYKLQLIQKPIQDCLLPRFKLEKRPNQEADPVSQPG